MVKAGRPQGGPRGQSEQANALAMFVREVTKDFTLRELAERYKISKTSWGEYRAGTKTIELHLLQRVIRDLVRDERTRLALTAKARELHRLTKAAETSTPSPNPSRTGENPPDQILRDADAGVRDSEELLRTLREVITHLQAAPPPPGPAPTAPGRTADRAPDIPPADGTLGEATQRLAQMEKLQATAEAVQARAREQRDTHRTAMAAPPTRDRAHHEEAAPATQSALTEIALALSQVRTALADQREEITELMGHLDVPRSTPQTSPAVVVTGEVLHRPSSAVVTAAPGKRAPRTRLRRLVMTSAVATATAATLTAGGWYLTHQQPAGSAGPAPATTPAAVAPTTPTPAAVSTSPAPPSPSAVPATAPQPSRAPTTAPPPPQKKESTAPPRATHSALPAALPVQWGHITNSNSALCLAVPGASRQSGKRLNQYPCGDYADHFWKAEPASPDARSDGLVRIVNYNSRQCLSVADASTENSAPVIQSTCTQSEEQYWQLEEHPDGSRVINTNSGQCMAVPAASTDALTEINQYPCGDYPDHYWHLEGR